MVKYKVTFEFDLDEILDQVDSDHHIDIEELNDQCFFNLFKNNDDTNKTQKDEGFLKYGLMIGGIALAIIAVVAVLLFMKKKSTKEEIEEVEETQEDLIAKLVKEKEAKIEREIAMEESEISLEDEIKLIVSKNTDETTELIKTWLNE